MTAGTQKLLEGITSGAITPANAASEVARAGGAALVIIELFRDLAAGGGGGSPYTFAHATDGSGVVTVSYNGTQIGTFTLTTE